MRPEPLVRLVLRERATLHDFEQAFLQRALRVLWRHGYDAAPEVVLTAWERHSDAHCAGFLVDDGYDDSALLRALLAELAPVAPADRRESMGASPQ